MTTKPRIPKLDNVTRIVINKISVWEMDNPTRWCKVSGGPGFITKSNINRDKTPEQMRSFVAKKLFLTCRKKVFENKNTTVFEDKSLYRYWISGNTLNITMRNL
jgi:hypothetical protein